MEPVPLSIIIALSNTLLPEPKGCGFLYSRTNPIGRVPICNFVTQRRSSLQTRPIAGHLDMRLMSRCRHYVLANSSFSWWESAWLPIHPERRSLLLRAAGLNCGPADTSDLIPSTWVRL